MIHSENQGQTPNRKDSAVWKEKKMHNPMFCYQCQETAGCAKYKYSKLPLGEIGGIPRVLNAGQRSDCCSLAVIAPKLKEAFGPDDINGLPIVYSAAWYEQKAGIGTAEDGLKPFFG